MLLFTACASVAQADFSNDAVPVCPDVLARIISGAEQSGDPLCSHLTEGASTVYYLRGAEYVGECQAPFGKVHIAQLFFVRSGVQGQITPPPRGHGFLVFYDAEFRVRRFWADVEGRFSLQGTKLFQDDKELFDYARLPGGLEENAVGGYPQPPVWK